MKFFYILIIAINILLTCFHAVAQQQAEPCATEILFREAAKKDPSLLLKRQALEDQTTNFILLKKRQRVAAEQLRIIPVVVHVIHEGGPENISKAQIEDQIRILNEDYRRFNADTINTPAPFVSVGADCNIEFRLAKKDPLGNCTDGIVRVFSDRTNNANDSSNADEIKKLSVWDNSRYLNIWTVKSFVAMSKGTLLGYAQFPDGGPNALDGVVILSSYIGSIGTALNNTSGGRVATHEIGHWLNLRHTWGDAECGTDQVEDTPPQEASSVGCPVFPQVTCGGPNGDMFSNYMDYSNGKCQNIFTKGQKLRMDATLAGFRAKTISQSNLVFTGTDDASPNVTCLPKVAFTSNYKTVCEGSFVTFNDGSYNGTPNTTSWTFEGGSPQTSTDPNPVIQYVTAGAYRVTLVAENSAGSATLTKEQMIYVSAATPSFSDPFVESFEDASYPDADWIVVNDDNGPTWAKTTACSYSGNGSIKIENFSGNQPNEVDELISPTIDLTNVPAPKLTFRLAYGQKDPAYQDKLTIFVSTDCGKNWTLCYSKLGNALSAQSGGLQYTDYVPKTKAEWKMETVDLNLTTTLQRSNVRLKFQFTSGTGNNIYIDDVNISKVAVGMESLTADNLKLTVYPNPGDENMLINFSLDKVQEADLKIYDVLGREVTTLVSQKLAAGDYQFNVGKIDHTGIYFLKLKLDNAILTRKLILNSK